MALSIKNKEIQARVHRLAKLTGLTHTAAVDDAVRRRVAELEGRTACRAERIAAVVRSIQVDLTPAERDALRGADDLLYGANRLPR